MPYLRLPNGSYVEVDEGVSAQKALALAKQQFPEAFEAPVKADTGFTGAFKSSLEGLKGEAALLAGKTGLMDEAEAEKYYRKKERLSKQMFRPTEEGWLDAPIEKFKETLGGSVPYTIAPIAAGLGIAALPVTGTAATALGLGATGLASATQFTGTHLARQMDTGKSLADTDLLAAGAAAIPAAALDTLSLRMIPGLGRIFGAAGKELPAKVLEDIAKQSLMKTVGAYTLQTGKTAGIEGLTEAAQQVLERLQAGLNITDAEARSEYFDSFIGGAALGGTFAIPGKYMERSKQQRDFQKQQKEEQDRLNVEKQIAEDARRASPEYRLELETKRNDLQAQISSLEEIAKDKNLEKTEQNEAKRRIKELKGELRPVLEELKESPAETAKKTIDDILEERRVAAEQAQEQEKQRQSAADMVKANQDAAATRYRTAAKEIDDLQTALQNAMKEGNVDEVDRIGGALDKRKVEFDILSEAIKKSGIEVRDFNAQLRDANTVLNRATKALTAASEDQAAALDPTKRAQLTQAVRDAQAKVEQIKAQQQEAEARQKEQEKAEGFRLAELRRVEQEEAETQPYYSEQEKQVLANKDVDSRLAGTIAAAKYYTNLMNADKRTFLDNEINNNKLTHDSLEALGLEELQDPDKPPKISKPRKFDADTKDAQKLQKQVLEQLEQIEANEALAKKYGLDIAPDPRTPYLRNLFSKIEDNIGVDKITEEQRAKYARPTEVARKLRGEDLPILTAYKSPTGAPVATKYTPAQLGRIRKDIAEIKNRLAADKAKAKVKGIKPKARPTKEIQRDKRRLARLEADVENAMFYRGMVGVKPTKLDRLRSKVESLQIKMQAAPTPALGRQLDKAESDLREEEKKATITPATAAAVQAKGEKVSPAKRAEEALFDVMDVIDQLRKGEFFGGAASTEGKLEGQPKSVIVNNAVNDIDSLTRATISEIDASRYAQKKPALTDQERQDIKYIIYGFLGGKIAHATGWRAEKQRAKGVPKVDTAISNAFKAAGLDIGSDTFQKQYEQAIKKAQLSGLDVQETGGEGSKILEDLKSTVDSLQKRYSDAVDDINAQNVAGNYDQVAILKKTRDSLSDAYRNALKAYEAAREDFTKGEALGKGEIRTGMRGSEREDIRDRMMAIKREFGLAEVKAVEEKDEVTKMPAAKVPESIKALQDKAAKLIEKVQGLAKGIEEAINMLVPVETRADRAALDKFSQDRDNVLDIARALKRKDLIEKLDNAATLDSQAAVLLTQHGYVPYAEDITKMAYSLHQAADVLRNEVNETIHNTLKGMASAASNKVIEIKAEAKEKYRDVYNRLRELNDSYLAVSKELTKEVESFHKQRVAEEGVARAKAALTEGERTGEAIKKGESAAARKTGLGLTGKKQEAKIIQGALSNFAIANMRKKVTELRKLFAAKEAGPTTLGLSENERAKAQKELDASYNAAVTSAKEFAQKEGLGTDPDTVGGLMLRLAETKDKSPEATRLNEQIEGLVQDLAGQAMRLGKVEKVVTAISPETKADQREKNKELQAEQVEELKRTVERKRARLTENVRKKMVEVIQHQLDEHNIKEAPDKTVNPKAYARYINKRAALQAELDVAKNADLETLRSRANIREAADLRYTPPSKAKLTAQLKDLKKQQAKKDTPSIRANIAKVEGALKYIASAKTAETGVGAEGYITERKDKAEQEAKARVFTRELPPEVTRAREAAEIEKKRLEGIQAGKNKRANARILADAFDKAIKGLNYEEQGREAAKLSKEEYSKLVKNQTNAWAEEASDTGLNLGDFEEVFKGMRNDFDPRIEPAHGGKGLTRDAVLSHIKSVTLPKGLKIKVVSTLTPTLRGAGLKHGLTEANLDGLRGGVTPDGTVFVVADAHADLKDLNATLAHEITGHLGVEQTLGQAGMDALARQVAKQDGGVFKLADKLGVGQEALGAYMAAKRAGKDEAFAQAKALREVIAHTEEARVDKNFLQKAGDFIKALVGAVRAALRKMGVNLDINTSDIYKILRNARKEFKEYSPGAYTARDGEVQFRAADPVFGGGAPGIVSLAEKLMPKQKGLKDRVFAANTGLAFETRYINRAAPIEAAFRNKGLDDSIQATQVQYALNMHDQRMAWTAQATSTGVPKLRKAEGGGVILQSLEGANLKQLTEALAKANWGDAAGVRDAYSLYRIAKRAANPKVGLAKLNFEGKITQAELDAVMRDVNTNPNLKSAFAEADKIYNQYNKDLMNLLVQVGALKPEVAADLVADNDYIPYYRVENDEVFLDIGGAPRVNIGNLQYQPYLHELVGGNERIVDIYSGALQNTTMLMDMALRNMATRNVAYALRDMGFLQVASKDEAGGGIRQGKGPASDRTIRFRRDGVDYYAVVNTEAAGIPSNMLVHGLSGVNTSLPNIVKSMGAPARLLRSWVTRNPAYAARQVVRDPLVAVMSGGVDTMPIVSSLKEVYKAMRGQSEGEKTLQSYGLIGGQVFTGTSEDMAKIMLQLTSGKKGWESYLAKADTLAMQGDAATRTVAFDNYRKQGLTEMEAIVAVHKMMPFSQRGTSPSLFMLSTMIPFLNAQIQGLNVLYKSFRGKMPFNQKLDIQGKLFRRGMMMAGLSMIYALMMEDDEAYKNANDDERYKNWFVYVPGVDEPVRVPIPFELGFIFKSVPEALVNTMFGDKRGAEAAKALAKMVAESAPIGPSTIPQAVKSPIEIMANYSFYTGRPIVSERLQDVDPAERFNDNTLELAKMVGSVTGKLPILGNYMSPVQLEYLVRGYLGGFPIAVASMTNPVFRSGEAGQKPEMRASDMPVIGSFFQPVDAGGVINRAYRDMEDVIKAKQTYDKLEEEGRTREASAYLDAKADLIALSSAAGTFRQKMGELTKQERAIKGDPYMSGPEKRKMLDDIRQQKISLAKELSSERE